MAVAATATLPQIFLQANQKDSLIRELQNNASKLLPAKINAEVGLSTLSG